MKIARFGTGKMGTLLSTEAEKRGDVIVPLVDCDVVIDFSHASVSLQNLREALEMRKPIVIGTSGWEDQIDEAKALVKRSGGTALHLANGSPLVYLMGKLLAKVSRLVGEEAQIEAEEIHHVTKVDAPSGTAKWLEGQMKRHDVFTSKRIGETVGTHQVCLSTPLERLSITHTAQDRALFAKGALQAADWLQNQTGWNTMEDWLGTI